MAIAIDLCLASAEDRETVARFLVFQEIGELPSITK